jgi:hypothetical protein
MRHTYNTYGYTAKNEAGRLHRVTLKALNMVSDMRSRMASGFKAPHINQECSSSGAARSSCETCGVPSTPGHPIWQNILLLDAGRQRSMFTLSLTMPIV